MTGFFPDLPIEGKSDHPRWQQWKDRGECHRQDGGCYPGQHPGVKYRRNGTTHKENPKSQGYLGYRVPVFIVLAASPDRAFFDQVIITVMQDEDNVISLR